MMSLIVEVITSDENIYQIVTLFPDCRQCYNMVFRVELHLSILRKHFV